MVFALAKNQLYTGASVTVAGLRDSYCDVDTAGLPFYIHKTRIMGIKSLGFSPQMRSTLTQKVIDCDIVHYHSLWMWPGYAARVLAANNHKPLIISPHGMLESWAIEYSRWKKKLAGWLFENRNLRSAVCIHALCESEYNSIRSWGLENPVCVIPNGINSPERTKNNGDFWTSRIGKGKKVLLFIGRIHPKKGLDNLIRAWASIIAYDMSFENEWVLVIAGWSQRQHEDKLRKKVAEYNLKRNVIFLGPLFNKEKAAALENSHGFILPSFSEGLPISVLEAWAYGLPVMMTPECNIPEGFKAGAAIEIKTDVSSIVEGLINFMKLPDLKRRAIGNQGKHLVETKFQWSEIARQMIAVYDWVRGYGEKPDCVRLN